MRKGVSYEKVMHVHIVVEMNKTDSNFYQGVISAINIQ